MAKRACLVCGYPTEGSRCPRHRRTNNSTARGYGIAHQRMRAALADTLPAPCWYGCGTVLHPGDPWVAAHEVDGDPTSPRHVSCRSCNERNKRRP